MTTTKCAVVIAMGECAHYASGCHWLDTLTQQYPIVWGERECNLLLQRLKIVFWRVQYCSD